MNFEYYLNKMNELPEKDLCYTINKLLYSAARLVKSPDLHNHSKATDINPHRRRTNLSFETSENKHYDVYSQQGHREHVIIFKKQKKVFLSFCFVRF